MLLIVFVHYWLMGSSTCVFDHENVIECLLIVCSRVPSRMSGLLQLHFFSFTEPLDEREPDPSAESARVFSFRRQMSESL